MSQVKQTGGSNKLGSEQGNSSDCERLDYSAKKMEELQDMVNQKFNSIIDHLEQRFDEMNQKIMKLQLTLEKLLATTRINPENRIQDTEQRCLNLHFNSSISLPILTGQKIKAESGNYMQVFLVDNCTGTVVDSEPEASAKVEIVALKGDLNKREGDTSTAEEFRSATAGEREGKKSVLAGTLQLKLNKGIVSLSDIKFRSSARHNSGVFMLGARAVDTFHGTRIIEAKTKPFEVKDYRRKYIQKHHPPSASDEVWRLKNIGKDGPIHERLMGEEVNSVEDFNNLRTKDPERLRHLLGLPKTKWEETVTHAQTCLPSKKKWEATVTHAQTCPTDKKKYCCQDNIGVVNAVEQAHASILRTPSHEHEGVVSLSNEAVQPQNGYTPHSPTAVEPVKSSRPESIRGNHIEHSEVGEFDDTNLNSTFECFLSPFNTTGFSSIIDSGIQSTTEVEIMNISNSSLPGLGSCSTSNGPVIIYCDCEHDVSDLLNEVPAEEICNNHQSADTAVMFVESQAFDPKKIWTTLFHISKWFSRRKRIASFERNEDKKKQRVCL